MSKEIRNSRVLRAATLMFSMTILGALVVQASLTAGCGGSESSIQKAPEQANDSPAKAPPVQPSAKSEPAQQLELAPPHMGGSKSGAILWPEEKAKPQEKQINAPPSNANAKR